MKNVFFTLPRFIGRHWLRVLIIGAALITVSRKQVNFNVRLGSPAEISQPSSQPPGGEIASNGDWALAATPAPEAAEVPPSFLSGLFGGDEAEVVADQGLMTEANTVRPRKKGFLERFSLFGGGSNSPSLYNDLQRTQEATVAAYVRRFSNVARAEQAKFGIPASITLANGLLQTNAGTSASAQTLHNFFAIRCGGDWPGDCDRSTGPKLRTYATAWDSFRDHSRYVTTGHYAPMTQFGANDYRKWAAGLEELGFNETDDLAEQLVQTIEHYQLFQFD
ncbi:glucosaminidase domain-containing protein [Neolewinella antarctica]|uniref:Mannosyl-glycoprotein endo-beta-N-acetylglucosamidase-like domain-containing protein n=1 Tax=Neolewinella antarctica TaxID=442734 RepID=A0ABX0XF73_9BACT|nr:glucosaminidase domain-containing protein [Neolewinella antarctica]NJC27960.1 hypothetical protein [Neolewinella antarctica]